ncbi:MAG: hypothetical protein KIS77_16820 [Saprospiraceae bacterium]|nr:hypothetical protein [Saprospiraceae bacterium]
MRKRIPVLTLFAGQTRLFKMKNQERFAAAPPTAAGRLSESWMVVGTARNNRGLAQTDGTESLTVPKPMGFSMARSLRIFECAYHVVLKVERNQF